MDCKGEVQSSAGTPLTSRCKTDASKAYIDWAIKHDFGVIDVNIPKHITGIDVSII